MAGKTYSITVNQKIEKILEKIAEEKGLSKSAVVALALEKFYREEENRNNDKK